MEDPTELKSANEPDFIKDFLKKTEGLTKIGIAKMVRQYGGREYSRGFIEGCDPDYGENDFHDAEEN